MPNLPQVNLRGGGRYSFSEIDLAPESPGVYAWYSTLEIGKADVEALIEKVRDLRNDNESAARSAILAALERFIISPYRESPYDVRLKGQLQPAFSGTIFHDSAPSESLITRLLENPERLRLITEVLRGASPYFSAPLYIGMSMNLRGRLKQHQAKIIELRDIWRTGSAADVAGAGFANQVVARGFKPKNLFVHIAEVPLLDGEQNDVENILNRITYPILGRN